MVKHVTDLIKLSVMSGTSISPATNDMFTIEDNSPLLPEKQREFSYYIRY